MVDSEDRYSTEKASSVQSTIIHDCDAEALPKSIRPIQSYSLMIKWRCCPELVQFHGFRSIEILLDTPPGSPENYPEARGGSIRVQISLSRPDPVTWRLDHGKRPGRGINSVTLTGSSLARHVALPDQGVGLDVDRLCSCLIVGRLVDHMSRTDRECYNGGGGYGGDKGGNSCRCRSSYADAILSKVHG
ncbi:hypothetical protein F2Q68_00020485 [Brassica cretica]|uniref:Uncharacterized protein n=1 Tax=Brassica cretica TaxID=69181 RepID=A0A8S9G5D0_BRACR|nr:hypothetical protein F2Q68_00020485 [Brassica cretica]